jgi:hypothetical protein
VVKHVRRHHPDQADPNQGVGKDPTTPTVHLHDVKLENPSPPTPAAPTTGPEGWAPTTPSRQEEHVVQDVPIGTGASLRSSGASLREDWLLDVSVTGMLPGTLAIVFF